MHSIFSVSPCTGIYVGFTTFNSDLRCVENCIKNVTRLNLVILALLLLLKSEVAVHSDTRPTC